MFLNYLLNMLELDIGLVDGGQSNFDESFLQFHVKKKQYVENFLNLTGNAE